MKNNTREWIILYFDMLIRGLIAFFFAGIILYAVLVGIFKVKPIYTLPIAFIVSILISPFLSKIKVGEKLIKRYDEWLENIFIKKKEEKLKDIQ